VVSDGGAPGRGNAPDETRVLWIGCTTEGATDVPGIHRCLLDMDSGALHVLGGADGVANPSYLAFGRQSDVLYAVQETSVAPSVHALRILADGDLVHEGQQPVSDEAPCHLSVDPSGRWLAVAAYGHGTVALYPLDADGRIGDASNVVQHRGRGVHPTRQEGPHAHAAVFTSDGAELLVPDLGLDEVARYRISRDGGMEPQPSIRFEPGSGPRHLAFGQGGRLAYVLNELTSSIALAVRDGEGWSVVQYVPCLPSAYQGENTAAAIRIAPSARFLYASNRGHDSIAVFAVDPDSGHLALVEHVATGGATPRDFAIDPSGRLLVVANQDAGTLVSFWIDPATGRLDATGHTLRLARPACVLMR
jgi:6-phosphogluconolactonase